MVRCQFRQSTTTKQPLNSQHSQLFQFTHSRSLLHSHWSAVANEATSVCFLLRLDHSYLLFHRERAALHAVDRQDSRQCTSSTVGVGSNDQEKHGRTRPAVRSPHALQSSLMIIASAASSPSIKTVAHFLIRDAKIATTLSIGNLPARRYVHAFLVSEE